VPIVAGISDGAFTELVSGDLPENAEVIVEMTGKTKKDETPAPRFF